MNDNIYFIAFGTFGNPNGFRQTFFIGSKDLANNVKTFDLNTNAIQLFPQSKLYSIRKEHVNGLPTIAYAVYTFAKEHNSNRSGTFIGSSILFTEKIAAEHITINYLNEFHENLITKNVQNDIILVNHSDNLSVLKPKDFDKTELNFKDIDDLNFLQYSNKYLVVFCETNSENLQKLFSQAIDLLNVYDIIYFTSDEKVATFVNQKRIFKLIQNVGDKKEFAQEIKSLNEERKRKIESTISGLEKEKLTLKSDQNKLTAEHEAQIEKNKKIHLENERKIKESTNDLNKINHFYTDFYKEINDLINQLTSGRKPDDVKQLYFENKRIFIDGINQLKKPQLIHHISKQSINTSLRVENQYTYQNEHKSERKIYGEGKEKYRIDIFKVISFVLFLLWIATLICFLLFNKKEENAVTIKPQQTLQITKQIIPKPPSTDSTIQKLNPIPNAELTVKDYLFVAKKLKYNININDVVKTIFDTNPTDIKSIFANQTENYSNQLVSLNKDCFEKKDNIFFFVKDTLKHIPSYKK